MRRAETITAMQPKFFCNRIIRQSSTYESKYQTALTLNTNQLLHTTTRTTLTDLGLRYNRGTKSTNN